MDKLKQWLRMWLGIADNYETARKASQSHTDELARIEGCVNAVRDLVNLAELEAEALVGEEGARATHALEAAVQNLQEQITDLQSPGGAVATTKPKPAEETQIDPGFRRFSQRKRDYEASKRQPMNETTKQITENARLIASGTRKSDTPAS